MNLQKVDEVVSGDVYAEGEYLDEEKGALVSGAIQGAGGEWGAEE